MIEEIKFEEIIRTENGKLYKIVSANEQDFLCVEMKENATSLILLSDLDIKTHSENIIDLIEVGDYVNGEKIKEINKNYITVGNMTLAIKELTGIKAIVTKEQFESVSYKV